MPCPRPIYPILLALVAITNYFATPATQAAYTFTLVADTSSSIFGSFDSCPALNAAGTVSFFAGSRDSPTRGVYTSSGNAVVTVTDTNTPTITNIEASVSYSATAIADSGTVLFGGWHVSPINPDLSPQAIFTETAGIVTPIASQGSVFQGIEGRSINDAGEIAFMADLVSGGEGIYVSDHGVISNVANNTTANAVFDRFGTGLQVNNDGTVAFRATLKGGGEGIFEHAGGVTTTVVDTNDSPYSRIPSGPVINDDGRIAFFATLDGGGEGIFSMLNGVATTIVIADERFSNLGGLPAINSHGVVGFMSELDHCTAIFTGDGTALTEVIRAGGNLFGSTVQSLNLGSFGLNDAGQIAFWFELADGRQGLAVASPVPEPGVGALVITGVMALLMRRRKSTIIAIR